MWDKCLDITETPGYQELKKGRKRIEKRTREILNQMTRTEAIAKLAACIPGTAQNLANPVEAALFVDRLAALGVLKLEENFVHVSWCDPIPLKIYTKGHEIINELVQNGYEIKKIKY